MTLRVDGDENLYGEKVSAQRIVKGEGIIMPDEAKPLIAAIKQATAKAAEEK